jgi:S-DNA-T family DNA segregation ATPase FtsK/SpoIIIE
MARLITPTDSRRMNGLVGFVYSVSAILLLLSLVSYSPLDPSVNTAAAPVGGRPEHNWIGVFGSYSSDLLLQLFGVLAFLLPVALGYVALRWFRARKIDSAGAKLLGLAALVGFAGALLAMQPFRLRWLGVLPIEGLTGRLAGDALVHYFNLTGAYIVAFSAMAVALYLTTAFSLGNTSLWLKTRFSTLFALRDRYIEWRSSRARRSAQKDLERRRQQMQKQQEREKFLLEKKLARAAKKPRTKVKSGELPFDQPQNPEETVVGGILAEENDSADPYINLPQEAAATLTEAPVAAAVASAAALPAVSPLTPAPIPAEVVAPPVTTRADAAPVRHTTLTERQGGWKLPSSTLLKPVDARNEYDEQELKALAQTLTEKCGEFDVRGQVTQINPGPVVTTYEFKPEAGVKLARITSLSEDLCLALRAESILIERMPGKSTVGVQVPNARREIIGLREVIESTEFAERKSKLTISLGKDINGHIRVTELNTMPHLLIAGSTGSGKSVAVNAFIMSILYKATPDQVRLILVDPKRLELSNYADVPHLYTPIIAEPKLASNALRNAVREMERRLKLLASRGVRNIEQYNKLFEQGTTPSLFDSDGAEEKPLPYIVIIIDELADLMIVDGANVEESITRLAQMARAIGIHLVLATQRPSVDVITGLIKANFPARMSFRVATKIDSRTILDANGAEHLLGKGDMLYLPSGSARLHRMHAPFVSEKEIEQTVEFWKAQATAQYDDKFLKAPAEESAGSGSGGDDGGDDNDPMFEDAVKLVMEFGKASTSLIQRRLRVGYGRAAHLIDMMEADGIVGPADGPKPREILKRPDWLSEIEDSLR